MEVEKKERKIGFRKSQRESKRENREKEKERKRKEKAKRQREKEREIEKVGKEWERNLEVCFYKFYQKFLILN